MKKSRGCCGWTLVGVGALWVVCFLWGWNTMPPVFRQAYRSLFYNKGGAAINGQMMWTTLSWFTMTNSPLQVLPHLLLLFSASLNASLLSSMQSVWLDQNHGSRVCDASNVEVDWKWDALSLHGHTCSEFWLTVDYSPTVTHKQWMESWVLCWFIIGSVSHKLRQSLRQLNEYRKCIEVHRQPPAYLPFLSVTIHPEAKSGQFYSTWNIWE